MAHQIHVVVAENMVGAQPVIATVTPIGAVAVGPRGPMGPTGAIITVAEQPPENPTVNRLWIDIS